MPAYGIDKNRILKITNSVLPQNKAVKEFGLVFVSADKMAELNKKYRGRSGATNVLTFEEGDIALCLPVIRREAKSYGFTQKKWMTRLVVHGILHLAGYEHGLGMERLEERILNKLGINPI